jgi:ankyrin repeat protein
MKDLYTTSSGPAADVESCVEVASDFPGLGPMSLQDPVHRQTALDMGLYENAEKGNADCVAVLVTAGGNVEGPFLQEGKLSNYSPLAIAANRGDLASVRVLLKHGANPRLAWDGATPLHGAARFGSVPVVQELLSKNADVDAVRDGQFTALYEAAARCKTDVVRALLTKGAKNIPARDGSTPLATAKAHNCTETAAVLSKAFGK